MAVSFYTGIPRSGKSYKAVVTIYNNFVPSSLNSLDKLLITKGLKKPFEYKYFNCYTNINQFNFSISDKIFKFDFNEIYEKLNELYLLYMDKKTDDELIEKAKELNLFKTLFVIDEAQNFFKSKENPVLTWWFTYHAHFYQDIILITQDLKLVNEEYKRVAEFFYKAIPQRLRLSKNTFRYRSYSSWQMYQKDYINTEKVKANKKYFDLYVSGANVTDRPIIYKYFVLLFVLLLSIYFAVQNFYNQLDEEKQKDKHISNPTKEVKNENIDSAPENIKDINVSSQTVQEIKQNEIKDNLKLFKFNCFDKFCYYKIDKKSTIEIPMNILKSFLMNIDEDKKFTEILNNRLYIYVLVDETKFNFINKGVTNENKENNTNILPTVGLNK